MLELADADGERWAIDELEAALAVPRAAEQATLFGALAPLALAGGSASSSRKPKARHWCVGRWRCRASCAGRRCSAGSRSFSPLCLLSLCVCVCLSLCVCGSLALLVCRRFVASASSLPSSLSPLSLLHLLILLPLSSLLSVPLPLPPPTPPSFLPFPSPLQTTGHVLSKQCCGERLRATSR